ncbi:hypothetical protein TRIUR3_32603 [Triticum urartu]|uniref:Uncharacterized protein n=1 Tax=Triticum urartu TaxID=4572 RepID=M7YGK8_TRIUA|nr:hypothetical protein TRIUR3_32603 [Triticum urartu]
MRRLWRWYQQSLSSYPVRTQVVSSGILWALGDIGAQAVTHKSASSHHHHAKNPEVASQPPLPLLPSPATDPRIPWSFLDAVAPQLIRSPGSGDFPGDKDKEFKIDWKRVGITSSFGFAFVGPVGHYW